MKTSCWSTLDWCTLDWCTLDWCTVDWYTLDMCILDWCTLDWCTLDWCTLDWCILYWCILYWCTLDWCTLLASTLIWWSSVSECWWVIECMMRFLLCESNLFLHLLLCVEVWNTFRIFLKMSFVRIFRLISAKNFQSTFCTLLDIVNIGLWTFLGL